MINEEFGIYDDLRSLENNSRLQKVISVEKRLLYRNYKIDLNKNRLVSNSKKILSSKNRCNSKSYRLFIYLLSL